VNPRRANQSGRFPKRPALALIVAVLLTSSCAADQPITSAPEADSTTVLSQSDLDAAAQSVVGVVIAGCRPGEQFGTGVVVADDLVVTSAHTVAGANEISVVADGTRAAGVIVAFDKNVDLAVLRTTSGRHPLRLGAAVGPEPVTLLTWRPEDGVRIQPGSISRLLLVTIEDIYIQGSYKRDALEIAAPVVHGDSGGPVLNDRGEVVGVIYASSSVKPDIGFAVSSTEIRKVLDRVGDPVSGNSRCT